MAGVAVTCFVKVVAVEVVVVTSVECALLVPAIVALVVVAVLVAAVDSAAAAAGVAKEPEFAAEGEGPSRTYAPNTGWSGDAVGGAVDSTVG